MRSGRNRRHTVARDSKKLRRYAAAAAAVAAGGGAGSVADAAIVSQSGLSMATPTTLNFTNAAGTSTVASFNFVHWTSPYYPGSGGSGTIQFPTSYVTVPGSGFVPMWVALGQGSVANLAAGVTVDGSIQNVSGATTPTQLSWASTANPAIGVLGNSYQGYAGNFIDKTGYGANVSGYIGIRFRNASMGNIINYGWIAYTGSVDGSGLITGWGYEDSGAGIATGAVAVPEPSGLALLAAGSLAGTAAVTAKRWRRRQPLPAAA